MPTKGYCWRCKTLGYLNYRLMQGKDNKLYVALYCNKCSNELDNFEKEADKLTWHAENSIESAL